VKVALPAWITGGGELTALRANLWLFATLGPLTQGVLSLILLHWGEGANKATHGVLSADNHHPWIHIGYGALIVWALLARRPERELALFTTVFGSLYLGFAVLGALTDDPLGIRLGPGENVFHLVVGTSALFFGLRSLYMQRAGRIVARS
jgi:hypothetical protein